MYGDRERGVKLRFTGTDAQFKVNSVPTSRDGMVLKARAEATVNRNVTVSLEYQWTAVTKPSGQQAQCRFELAFLTAT
ncbi:hypothetical protein RCM37_06090 [Escherichia coli]|nr:hypothetical protein [Escherichia coli]MED0107564.1 hypothetical protein [Escherichia coli]MED0144518.1 hypothetical protein [Escherichia coli]MED0609699.1 hypothetical protein [Escherichia coli]MED8696473.1 hypothetical protein [Escherichia coli]